VTGCAEPNPTTGTSCTDTGAMLLAGNLFYQVRYDGLVVAGAGVPAGASAETAVPAGHVVVECQWGSTSETKEIDLDVGKDAELVFGSDGG